MSAPTDAPPEDRGGDPDRANDSERGSRGQGKSYDVGYGKPPVETRFKKGKSGNPRGRPRRPKRRRGLTSDSAISEFLHAEVHREVALRENGQPIHLPVVQAVLRSLATEGIKGKRLSQKLLLQWAQADEQARRAAAESEAERKESNYLYYRDLKRRGEKMIAEHERRGLPPPDILPHPDDIILDPFNYDFKVVGPFSREEIPFYEFLAARRDLALWCSANAQALGHGPVFRDDGDPVCAFLVMATVLDKKLPKRYRRSGWDAVFFMQRFRLLTRRERKRLIREEDARLEKIRPEELRGSPEEERQFEKIVSDWIEKRSNAGRESRSQDVPTVNPGTDRHG